jgi:PTS system nitrogen regulatory IIA component
MEIADLIAPERVIASLRVPGKRQALQELARRAAAAAKQDERDVFEVLWERERLGSTGIGMGTAVPHGKLPRLDRLYGVFARLERPIDFNAIDDRPVDLIFALLAPENAGADHLKALACVSRLLRNRAICEKLRGTDSAEALYALLTEHRASDAA